MATKCYHCKIIGLTNIKQEALSQEYNNLQHYLQTREDKGLYSAIKQQADRFYKVIKKDKKYPLSVRNDLLKIEKNKNVLTEYWCRIPVKAVRGGIWVGIKPYEPIPSDVKVCESKVFFKNKNWWLDIVVKKNIPEKTEYQNVMAIDMGIKHIACSVDMASGKTVFYGNDLNRVRGHYFWLRRKLGMKKAIDTIKKIGHHEKRIANNIVHNISREIVNQAIETDSIIVLGNLKYLRKRKQRQYRRRMARLLSGFPYYKLMQYIRYKAALAGIKAIEVSEAWTSQICNKCRERGQRKTQGLFECQCGVKENADRNAAFNIAKRGLGYCSKLGVVVSLPRTVARVDRNPMMTMEATGL
ncbi:MAG: transposase [Thermoproteota archaeon]